MGSGETQGTPGSFRELRKVSDSYGKLQRASERSTRTLPMLEFVSGPVQFKLPNPNWRLCKGWMLESPEAPVVTL
eukprot:724010-Alexandrium_andersonii.AAC.1